MHRRPLIAITGLLVLAGSVGGCGLRGDLYLEEQQAQQAKPDRRESLREKIGRQTVAEPDPVEFDPAATPADGGQAGDRATGGSDDSDDPQNQAPGPKVTPPAGDADSASRP